MTYEITVESSFSAAHRLKGYKGKCENLHGHNWRIQATFTKKSLDKIGLVMDFNDAKKILEQALFELDHKDINKIGVFKKCNPTSELIAKFVFKKIEKAVANKARLEKVSVWETPTSCASYSR
ncbi:MAG: 6-carboxytetrahydropterin synthase QueD [Candidatus Omnitrophota bacterium]